MSIEGVLERHTYMLQLSLGGICECGFVPTVRPETMQTQQDYHRAHVAAAVRAHLLSEEAVERAYETWRDSFYNPDRIATGKHSERHRFRRVIDAALTAATEQP